MLQRIFSKRQASSLQKCLVPDLSKSFVMYLASCMLLSRKVERIISAVAISLHLEPQDRITFGI